MFVNIIIIKLIINLIS